MFPPANISRLWFAAGLILSLGACALPRSGPDYSEVTAAAPQEMHFDIVRVTAAVTAAILIDERSGFARAFIDAPAENTATVAPGDVMAHRVGIHRSGPAEPPRNRRDTAASCESR